MFLTAASDMVGAYNREQALAREYYGRELLELLQNADDAGAEILQKNQVLIKLTENALYVANTGLPFSPAGVSMMIRSTLSGTRNNHVRVTFRQDVPEASTPWIAGLSDGRLLSQRVLERWLS